MLLHFFFFSSRRRHTRSYGDWSSDVCSSDLGATAFEHTGESENGADVVVNDQDFGAVQWVTRIGRCWQRRLQVAADPGGSMAGLALTVLLTQCRNCREVGWRCCVGRGAPYGRQGL